MKKRKYRDYLILALFIMLIYFVVTRFTYVFGSDTDWINQHTVIPDYFRQTFYNTGKLLPNLAFNYGGGQNIFTLSYYGLLSPIILPSYLLPFMSMSTYITIVNLLICFISGILFYKWLKSHGFSDNITLLTSILFVLSASFIFHMHRHMMFVNYMPFLIMSLIGVDKYIKDNKKITLILGIFLMIMTSYYYSVCGILVIGLYFIYMYLKNNEFNIKSFIKDTFIFIGYALIAIGLGAFFLLPTLYTMMGGRDTGKTAYTLLQLLTPFKEAHKIFAGTYSMGLSMIGFMSLMYMFFTKKRENVVIAALSSIILFIPLFMFLLNGGLYLREKCFIPFMPLIGLFIGIFLSDLYNNKINIKSFIIYLTIIFLPLYLLNTHEFRYVYVLCFGIILLFMNKKYTKYFLTAYILVVALSACITENYKEEVVPIDKYNEIFNDNIANEINNTIKKDKTYYRFANLINPTKTINKIYNKNYLSTNMYSSTYNYHYLDFVRDELDVSMYEYNYFMIPSKDNIIFNSLMGVKYVASDHDLGYGYTKISDNIYKNDYVRPLIYASNKILNEKTYDDYKLYPYNIEYLINNIVVDDISNNQELNTTTERLDVNFEIIENDGVKIEEKNNSKILTVENKGKLTIKLDKPIKNKLLFISLYGLEENTCSYDNISMKINNVENILTCKTWNYPTKNNTFNFLISDYNISTLNIELTKGEYKIDKIEAFVMDASVLNNKDYTPLNITSIKNDSIEGNIKVSDDYTYLATSIPYDKGWSAYVDGSKVEIKEVNKAFIGIKLDKGYHEIKLKYSSPLLKEGTIISSISLVLLIIVIISGKRNKRMQ